MIRRIGDIFINGAIRACRHDDCLLVVAVLIEREQKGRLLVVTKGAGERALIIAALLRWLGDCEGVLRVEVRVAVEEIARPMKLRRPTLGFNLYSGTTWSGIKRCVRILINLHAWIADAVTPGPFASTPFTTQRDSICPVASGSRNRDIVVM